jgi:hypothetical protein
MPNYDPFVRGPYPAGTRSFEWEDDTRRHSLPIDVGYPATDVYRGQNLDDATRDQFQPFVMSPKVPQDAVRDAEARTDSGE